MLASGTSSTYPSPKTDRLTDLPRLVLYYPTSALVTLFANILQNPQDARARPDLKLMRTVIDFLTTLGAEDRESLVHYRRMLKICSEFERICRVALEKAEKEMKGNRKRRTASRNDETPEKSIEQQQIEQQSKRPVSRSATVRMAASVSTPTSGGFPDAYADDQQNPPSHRQQMSLPHTQVGQPTPQASPSTYIPGANAAQYPADTHIGIDNGFTPGAWTGPMPNAEQYATFGQTPQDAYATTGPDGMPMATDQQQAFGNGQFDLAGAFQQPFVPQDLWQMPMTLEWDWADVGGLGAGMGLGMGMGMGMGGLQFDEAQMVQGQQGAMQDPGQGLGQGQGQGQGQGRSEYHGRQ